MITLIVLLAIAAVALLVVARTIRIVPQARAGDTGALGGSWFRCANLKLAVHGDGIAVHDFALKALCKRQGERGLPASRRAEYHDQQRFGRHGQRAPQAMWCQYRTRVRIRTSAPMIKKPAASSLKMWCRPGRDADG